MKRLSASEQEIRSSRGIPIWRFWPFAVMLLVPLALSVDGDLFLRCVGNSLYGSGRIAALVRMTVAIPCSLYTGSVIERLAVGTFFAVIPFAVLQVFWMRRHKAYWDTVRAREKLKRAEKRTGNADANSPESKVDADRARGT